MPSNSAQPATRRLPALVIIGVLALGLIVAGGFAAASSWKKWQVDEVTAQTKSLSRAGSWPEALATAQRWTQLDPGNGSAWLALAEAARQTGDLQTVADALWNVPSTDRRAMKALELRGDLLLDGLGRPAEAIANWQLMLQRDPAYALAHQRLIYVYAMTLQRQKMDDQIYAAIEQGAEPPEAYGYLLASPNLIFSDGFLRTRQWAEKSPEDQSLQAAFAVFTARTQPSKAISMFGAKSIAPGDQGPINDLYQQGSQDLEVLAFHAEAAVLAADMTKLAEVLGRLPESAEQDCRFWRFQGFLLDAQRRYDEAAECFERSIELFPLDWRSHHEFSATERSRGKPESASLHASLGLRGKTLERQVLELPNAAQADSKLFHELRTLAIDCGDRRAAVGLSRRLGLPIPKEPEYSRPKVEAAAPTGPQPAATGQPPVTPEPAPASVPAAP